MKHGLGQFNVTKVARTLRHVSCGNMYLSLSSQLPLTSETRSPGVYFSLSLYLGSFWPPVLTCTCLAATSPLNHSLPWIHQAPELGAASLSRLWVFDTTLCHGHPLLQRRKFNNN
jgi:hypothetical protein